jgi:transposase InsO family protein
MPWKECSQMSSRLEFVLLASAPSANIRQLCRIFGISPKTGYKLLARFHASGEAGLQDLSRRPKSSPGRTSDLVEQAVLELHVKYPYWGARKLQALLPDHVPKPHPNTIAAILRRHGKQVLPVTERSQEARIRFEHAAPNLLWQMDFKGHFPLTDARAGRCHPLTIVDDHSRFAVCLTALDRENRVGVQAALTETFRFYGLPERITCDNGAPWRGQDVGPTKLEAWLLRLGVRVSHSRPYHPQTQGKDERFHRTLKRELLDHRGFDSISRCQHAFDEWRDQYNLIRPHESLGQKPPITRYRRSGREFPEQLPPVEYEIGVPRRVRKHGAVKFENKDIFVGEGLAGETVALCPTETDGVYTVLFCNVELQTVDLREQA